MGVGAVVVAQERVGGGGGRGVFEDPPLFGEGIRGTLYALSRTKARLRVSCSSTDDHGDPAAGRDD